MMMDSTPLVRFPVFMPARNTTQKHELELKQLLVEWSATISHSALADSNYRQQVTNEINTQSSINERRSKVHYGLINVPKHDSCLSLIIYVIVYVV